MEYIITCPRSAYFHIVRKRRGAEVSPGLNFGGGMHEPLAYRYRECLDLVTPRHTAAMHDILKEWFEEKPNPVEDHRQLDLAIEMIDTYNHIYMVEPFTVCQHKGKPAVELPFAYELFRYKARTSISGPPEEIIVFWTGRIDAIIREEGQVLTMDHKTSAILGDGFFRSESMSGQHRGYAWAYAQEYGEPPAGFLINAMRVPRPTKAGLNVKPDGYQRAKYYLSPEDVEEWRVETIHHVSRFLDLYFEHQYFPAGRKWCVNKFGTCQYFDVCTLAPEHREGMLSSGMYSDNDWSPLYPLEPKEL
jgi:hypothetical protein